MEHNINSLNQELLLIADQLMEKSDGAGDKRTNLSGLKDQVEQLLSFLRSAMYPNVFADAGKTETPFLISSGYSLQNSYEILKRILSRIYSNETEVEDKALELIHELPLIKDLLETDIQAAYEGDPAAKSAEEIMLAYPAFEAISIYRIAHKLYCMKVPILPRIMTEYAHRITGIDIHPGATIGKYFFIDHGTGVVIGETTTIGDHVKLYQGVTLGAKSFEVNPDGSLVKGIKRHPDIGNHVVIYAGATILGGNTVIGDNCVIGGNVWLTHSVEEGKTIIAVSGESNKKDI